MDAKNHPARAVRARFSKEILALIRRDKILGIRAGRASRHRVIGIWAVVVEGRVFVRSWSIKPRSWWRTFQADPYGIIVVGSREVPVRAIRTRSERLKALVSLAYRAKYNTPGSIQYVRDMLRRRSTDTTTELVPVPDSQ